MPKKTTPYYKPMRDLFIKNLEANLKEPMTDDMKKHVFAAFWDLEGAELEARTLLEQHEKGEIKLDDETLRDCILTVFDGDNLKAIEKMNQLGLKNTAES